MSTSARTWPPHELEDGPEGQAADGSPPFHPSLSLSAMPGSSEGVFVPLFSYRCYGKAASLQSGVHEAQLHPGLQGLRAWGGEGCLRGFPIAWFFIG